MKHDKLIEMTDTKPLMQAWKEAQPKQRTAFVRQIGLAEFFTVAPRQQKRMLEKAVTSWPKY
jgi:hypothetical protein